MSVTRVSEKAKSPAGKIRIGISGWTYPPWRGVFFPEDLAQKRELEYASRQVNSIEINGTFYSLQRPKSYRKWHDATPDDFVFSVKANRYITHIRRLNDITGPLASFLASGPLCLGEKLGPFLWQFPPNLKYDRDKFAAFLDLLPHDTTAAAKLAKKHDITGEKDRVWLKAGAERPVRHAVEIRHESFENDEFVQLLRDHGVALVVADTAGKWPYMEELTADFMYVRLHGDEKIYVSGYTKPALKHWKTKVRSWAEGTASAKGKAAKTKTAAAKPRDVFVYFDNDVKVRAPFDAMSLAGSLGLEIDHG